MQAVDPLHDPPCPLNARFNYSVGDWRTVWICVIALPITVRILRELCALSDLLHIPSMKNCRCAPLKKGPSGLMYSRRVQASRGGTRNKLHWLTSVVIVSTINQPATSPRQTTRNMIHIGISSRHHIWKLYAYAPAPFVYTVVILEAADAPHIPAHAAFAPREAL